MQTAPWDSVLHRNQPTTELAKPLDFEPQSLESIPLEFHSSQKPSRKPVSLCLETETPQANLHSFAQIVQFFQSVDHLGDSKHNLTLAGSDFQKMSFFVTAVYLKASPSSK